MEVVVLIIGALVVVLRILFASGVYVEAGSIADSGGRLWFVGPTTWTLVTLMGGITTVAVYWLLHHSPWSDRQSVESGELAM